MTSVNEEGDLKQQVIQEMSRLQTSNLRRVHSSSGMKTIFSSDDYHNTLGQPKPLFRVQRGHHGPKGHHGHKTPQSPGKTRVRAKHGDYKPISADLFENHTKEELRSKANTEVSSFIPPDDPLATSTLKTDAHGVNPPTSETAMSETQGRIENTEMTASLTENGDTGAKTGELVDIKWNELASTPLIASSSATPKSQNSSSFDGDSLSNSANVDHTNTRSTNLVTSVRSESEVTLPDATIHHNARISSIDSMMVDEDHAIKALLELAEGQEAELMKAEASDLAQQYSGNFDKQNGVSSSFENVDEISSRSKINSDPFEREVIGKELSAENVTKAQRNSDGFTFDMNDIISSTPQAGSTYEENSTPSEIGSMYSGTGPRYERADVTNMQSNIQTYNEEKQHEPILSETADTNYISADVEVSHGELKTNQGVDQDVIPNYDTDTSDQYRTITKTEESTIAVMENEGTNEYDPTSPSQGEIDDTHRQFDRVLADLSTSIEEDFTMSEKTVGRQLSSEADVIVHSAGDDMPELQRNTDISQADTAQEFTDLESSIISVPGDVAVSAGKPHSQEIDVPEISRHSVTSVHANNQVNNPNDETSGKLITDNVEHEVTDFDDSRIDRERTVARQVSSSSHSEQDASQEFMDLEMSRHHLNQPGRFDIERRSVGHLDDKRGLETTSAAGSSNIEHNVEQSFAELNSELQINTDNQNEISSSLSSEHKVIYTEIPSGSSDNSPRESYKGASDITLNTGVYSEAYQTRMDADTPRDSVSESSPVYESISDDLNSSGIQGNFPESMLSQSKTTASGRLSPLGAEVSSVAKSSTWNQEAYKIGGGNTVLRVTSADTSGATVSKGDQIVERKAAYGAEKPPDSGFLPRTRPFGFNKAKSEFQALSENVNVKGLAKQLEKSLDFSKMLRSPIEKSNEKQTDTEASRRPVKKLNVNSEDPKEAFGLVLNEIFQKNRLRSVGHDDKGVENTDSQINFSGPSFVESRESRPRSGQDSDVGTANEVNDPYTSSREYIKAERSTLEQFTADSFTDARATREHLNEDESSIEVSSSSDTHSPRASVREEDSSAEVSASDVRNHTTTHRQSIKHDQGTRVETMSDNSTETSSTRESGHDEQVYLMEAVSASIDRAHSGRESIGHDVVITREAMSHSTDEAHSPRESISHDGMIMRESMSDSTDEAHSPRESIGHGGVGLLVREQMSDSADKAHSPRESISHDGAIMREQMSDSTDRAHSPRESIGHGGVGLLEREQMSDSTIEANSPRESISHDVVITREQMSDSTDGAHSPRESISHDGVITRESMSDSTDGAQSPRESINHDGAIMRESMSDSTGEAHSPHESISHDGAIMRESMSDSTDEAHYPRESIGHGGVGLLVREQMSDSTDEAHSPRESIGHGGVGLLEREQMSDSIDGAHSPRESIGHGGVGLLEREQMSGRIDGAHPPRESIGHDGVIMREAMSDSTDDVQSDRESLSHGRSFSEVLRGDGRRRNINTFEELEEHPEQDKRGLIAETIEHLTQSQHENDIKWNTSDRSLNEQSDPESEQFTYETEEIILSPKYMNDHNANMVNNNYNNAGFMRNDNDRSFDLGQGRSERVTISGYGEQDSLSDTNSSEIDTQLFHSNDRQPSVIRNENNEQSETFRYSNVSGPGQVRSYDNRLDTSRETGTGQVSSSYHPSYVSDSDQEESLGSISTLQDNDNLSDLSNLLDDTLGSRTEERAGADEYLEDYKSQRDISRNTSFSEDTYTSVHEEFYVPVPQPPTTYPQESAKGHDQSGSFPSYRERFFGRNTEGEVAAVTQSQSSTETFLHERGKESVSVSNDGFSARYPSVDGEERPRQASRENSSSLRQTSDTVTLASQPAQADTVQGRSVRQAHVDNRVFADPSGYTEKPAQQLGENNINITKKEDTWDHVTFSASSPTVYGVEVECDSDVTTQPDTGEEFYGQAEKLSQNAFSANLTSESRPQKYEKSLNGSNYSLFYEGSPETRSVSSGQRLYTGRERAQHQRGDTYQRGSMAYLLTGKERLTTDHNRSGRSTPQRKDLYVQEDILVSPTGVDERRGSHSSRDYLNDNHGGQDFFHFDMKSPSNNGRDGSEGRGERIQHIERSEKRTVSSAGEHVELLPDTYIGTSKSPELIPIQIQTNSNGQRADAVSRNSSNVSVHENKTAHNHGNFDKNDAKGSKSKISENTRTERVTTTYTSSPTRNGNERIQGTSDKSGLPRHTNIIHIETNSTGLESGRRERRDAELTSKRVTGKPSGDDNISISSLSSQSSSSIAEAGNSFDSPASRNHQRKEKRNLRSDDNRRVQSVSVEYLPETRVHASQGPMPKHAKKTHESRVYYTSSVEPDISDRENRSTQDVQYLIKSLENETRQPRRPIPGVDRDAFSYHVTSSGNENKSPSRNNHVNEVDVTTREAMRDRSNKAKGSSHVIRQYKEERIVEDVDGPKSVHLTPERVDSTKRSIVLQNGHPQNRAIKIHSQSLDRSDSDRTATFDDSKRNRKKDRASSGETKVYVDSSKVPHNRVKSEKVRVVKEKTYHRGHSVSSDDNSSDDEGEKHRKPESGKVSTVLYDFSSKKHPSLSNVVHLEGAKGLKSRDSVNSQDIYSTPRNTDRPYRARSSSESSLSDHDRSKGRINKVKSEELWLTQDLNRHQPRKYKSENVFYEHYNVKRENPMYLDGDKVVYVSPHTKHGARSPTREIYVDTKNHPSTRHQLSSSFSSISPTGSPTPEDRHVTTVSFDESFNRKRSGSPIVENNIYKPKLHVKKHRVVKTDEQIIRPAESDNELYVRGSRASPYRLVVKGDRHRSGRSSDTDESFYSDSRTTGSHRSTINVSRGSDRKADPYAPAVMSIPLSNRPVAMTIPGVQETKYVTNKSEKMELRRSASMDSIRDMVDYPTDLRSNSFRSEKVLHVGSSSDGLSSPDMRNPSSPYVSTITILNRKLNVKDPNVDSGNGTEIISSDDDIRYRSQLNPVKEEVVYATKEAPRNESRRSEKHTTYSTYEEYRDHNDSYEYVTPSQQSQQKVTTIRQERHIPIREERIHPVRQDRAKAVRESLHEKFSNMSYEQSHEPQQVEQKSSSDLKVVRGQFVIRNSMDIDLDEGDSLGVDDNINIFDNSFTMNKENPLYQSDPDLYNKFENETVEERTLRIKAGDFGDGFEDIIQNTRAAAVKSAPNKKKQNLSQMLLSRLAQIDSKDITQHIDVQHHNEEIYGDIKFIHADGSKAEAMDTTNFDSVSEHIDLMLKEGKALITIKVTAERIIPIDFEFNVWRKSQAIVTRNIEIDLKANDQRRRLYEHVMETTPRKMIGSGSSGFQESDEAVLSSKDTLKLFSRLLSVAEKDTKAVERDEVRYETKHRDRSDSLPSLSNADMLY